jgi:hypothetical protein
MTIDPMPTLIPEDLATLSAWHAGQLDERRFPSLLHSFERWGYIEKIDPEGRYDLTAKGRMALAYSAGV